MNLKKFISGVSALTIAASAFAGMAVTANAATKTTTVYTHDDATGSYNGTVSVDVSEALDNVAADDIITISYTLTTDVDYSEYGKDRPAWATLTAKDSSNADVNLFSLYVNTQKGWKSQRYAVGAVADSSSTWLGSTTDNASSHDFFITLNVDLGEDTLSGKVVRGENEVSADIASTSFDIASLNTMELVSGSGANKLTLSNFKITKNEEVEYYFTTVPYAKVTVDGNVYNSGATGSVNVSNPADGQAVTVEKSGYTTVNTTVDTANGNNVALVPTDSTVSYYEDFTNVEDGTFGFTGGATVANGSLKYSAGSGTNSTTLPATSTANKTVHFDLTSNCASTNHTGYLYLTGTGLSLYFYGSQIRLHGYSADKSKGVNTGFASSAKKVDLVFNTNGKASFYADGKFIGDVYYTGTDLTGFSADQTKGTFAFTMGEIAVKETALLVDVTIADEAAENTSVTTKYIAGTEITLPAAAGKDGYTFEGWSDGTNTYAAGAEVEVSSDVTYTAVYSEIVAPSANLTDAAWVVSDAETGYTADGNVLTDTNNNSVYGYQATLTGNGYAYDTVKVYVKVADGDANAEKTYSNTTFSASGSVTFYVISDTVLDKSASRVYCE